MTTTDGPTDHDESAGEASGSRARSIASGVLIAVAAIACLTLVFLRGMDGKLEAAPQTNAPSSVSVKVDDHVGGAFLVRLPDDPARVRDVKFGTTDGLTVRRTQVTGPVSDRYPRRIAPLPGFGGSRALGGDPRLVPGAPTARIATAPKWSAVLFVARADAPGTQRISSATIDYGDGARRFRKRIPLAFRVQVAAR